MKVINESSGTIIASQVRIADSFLSRMTGLLNRASIAEGEALIITQCRSIHMFFMRFAIDAVFVDKKGVVVGLVERIKPFRMSRIFYRAKYVIELAEGVIAAKKIAIGDRVEIEKGKKR